MRCADGFAVLAALWLAGTPAAAEAAKPRGFLLIDETFAHDAAAVERDLEALMRHAETVIGWKVGSTHVRLVTSHADAVSSIKKTRPAFGILSAHSFARLFAKGQPSVIGHAGFMPAQPIIQQVVARSDSPLGKDLYQSPGARLAAPPELEPQWVNVLFDGLIKPLTHFLWVKVASPADAIAAVIDGRADVAFIDKDDRKKAGQKFGVNPDQLKVVYATPPLPPPAVVAWKGSARPAESKQLQAALLKICVGEGIKLCGKLNMLYMRPGPHPGHSHLAYKYAHYK